MLRFIGCFESGSNIVEEYTTNDTSATPHTSNGGQIKMPVESIGSTLQHGESLCIRD